MKKTLSMLLIVTSMWTVSAFAQVRVKGYTRKDGTYVQSYTRSNPDSNPTNNYSYPGNYNPYTGKVATGNEQTYLDKYKNRTQSSGYSNPYPVVSPPALEDRTYVPNKKGENIMYQVVDYKSEMSTKFSLYDLSDNLIATATEYYDGDIYFYDPSGKLIKRTKGKNRKQ